MALRLIPVFDGSYDPESWLQAMEDYFEDSHILMEDYVNICISCLRGEATKWAKENESTISKNWCAFSYHLLWEFDPTIVRPELEEVDDNDEQSLSLIGSLIGEAEMEDVLYDSDFFTSNLDTIALLRIGLQIDSDPYRLRSGEEVVVFVIRVVSELPYVTAENAIHGRDTKMLRYGCLGHAHQLFDIILERTRGYGRESLMDTDCYLYCYDMLFVQWFKWVVLLKLRYIGCDGLQFIIYNDSNSDKEKETVYLPHFFTLLRCSCIHQWPSTEGRLESVRLFKDFESVSNVEKILWMGNLFTEEVTWLVFFKTTDNFLIQELQDSYTLMGILRPLIGILEGTDMKIVVLLVTWHLKLRVRHIVIVRYLWETDCLPSWASVLRHQFFSSSFLGWPRLYYKQKGSSVFATTYLHSDPSLNLIKLVECTVGFQKLRVEPIIPPCPRLENLISSWCSVETGNTLQTVAVLCACLLDPDITCIVPSKRLQNYSKYQDLSRGGCYYENNMQKFGFNVMRLFTNPSTASFSGLYKDRNLVGLSRIRQPTNVYASLAAAGSLFTVWVEILVVLAVHINCDDAGGTLNRIYAHDTLANFTYNGDSNSQSRSILIGIEMVSKLAGVWMEDLRIMCDTVILAISPNGPNISIEYMVELFQTQILVSIRQNDILKRTVDLYPSHPGICWCPPNTDMKPQQLFELQGKKAIKLLIFLLVLLNFYESDFSWLETRTYRCPTFTLQDDVTFRVPAKEISCTIAELVNMYLQPILPKQSFKMYSYAYSQCSRLKDLMYTVPTFMHWRIISC